MNLAGAINSRFNLFKMSIFNLTMRLRLKNVSKFVNYE